MEDNINFSLGGNGVSEVREDHNRFMQTSKMERMSKCFYSYGKLCSRHPWEVIVAFLTFSICLMTIAPSSSSCSKGQTSSSWSLFGNKSCQYRESSDTEAILVAITRFLAIFYACHHFISLYKHGSKIVVAIAIFFTIISSLIFMYGVISAFGGDFGEFITWMALFLLLVDLPKAGLLAQFALSSNSREEVRENIAKGMEILGPCLTLDTMVETLAMGVGTLSGVKRMEDLSYLACLSVVVNYLIFMTLFPACLSLALELSHPQNRLEDRPSWQLSSLTKVLELESEQAPNPVIQRVKIIMSAGLMLVHTLSRFQVETTSANSSYESTSSASTSNTSQSPSDQETNSVIHSTSDFESNIKTLFGTDIVLVALVFAIAIKVIFFNNKDHPLSSVSSLSKRETNHPSTMKDISVDSSDDSGISCSGRPSPQHPTITVSQDSDTESAIIEQVKEKMNGHGDNNRQRKYSRKFFIGDDSSSEASDEMVETVDTEVQTNESNIQEVIQEFKKKDPEQFRSIETLLQLINNEDRAREVSDEEILMLVSKKKLKPQTLESALDDPLRGVHIRRLLLARQNEHKSNLTNLPYLSYDYSKVLGACCENVIGYLPIPVGVAGPLLLNGVTYHVPMATTEGCLVASTNRGCRAITMGGGAKAKVYRDSMTRAPVVEFPTAIRAAEAMAWLEEPDNFKLIKEAFDSTSRFGRLQKIQCSIAANNLYIRLCALTGDAMGMNMLSKGAEIAINKMSEIFPDMQVIGLSGNFCTDKKPSAVNWIEGRGKSVVCEAIIPAKVVEDVLKTDVQSMVSLNIAKNLTGSALAGSIGGFNAHAANTVTAVFLATGQDPAQNVGSSNCLTTMKACGINNKDLHIACTMPSMEVGTIGGGTILPAQAANLELLGVRGSCAEEPGRNAKQLAQIICAAVMASELSIMAALAAGHLVRSHMKHNRSTISVNASCNGSTTPPASCPGSPERFLPRSGCNNYTI